METKSSAATIAAAAAAFIGCFRRFTFDGRIWSRGGSVAISPPLILARKQNSEGERNSFTRSFKRGNEASARNSKRESECEGGE